MFGIFKRKPREDTSHISISKETIDLQPTDILAYVYEHMRPFLENHRNVSMCDDTKQLHGRLKKPVEINLNIYLPPQDIDLIFDQPIRTTAEMDVLCEQWIRTNIGYTVWNPVLQAIIISKQSLLNQFNDGDYFEILASEIMRLCIEKNKYSADLFCTLELESKEIDGWKNVISIKVKIR